MHPLKVSCVGQTFALARCSDSQEKKTRRRRTKEERKTMVESFITKYRASNNGNFPSLNITHKEVGGSFYTVREIVREIIQENKVLGPGSLALKALNLESCLEEHTAGSFSVDHCGIDQNYIESYSLSGEHQLISEESYELVKSKALETSASHPKDCPVPLILHDKSFDHLVQNFSATYLDVNSVDVEYEVAHLRKSTHEAHQVNQPVPLLESVSITSSELGVTESDIGSNSNSLAGTTDFDAENVVISDITGANILPETKILSNSGNNSTSAPFQEYSASNATEVFPLTSAVKICSSDRGPFKAEDITSSLEVSGTGAHHFSNEVEVVSLPVDKDAVQKRTEPTDDLSSGSINEAPTARLMPPLSRTFGTTMVEPQLVFQPSDVGDAVMNTGSADCESPSPDFKVKYEVSASKCDRGSVPSSVSSKESDEEIEKEEINPVWAAVKAFVTAVVKFWTE